MPHISYSELKIWKECGWKHKLEYIDGLRSFRGNEFTAFGTALHTLCEEQVKGNLLKDDLSETFDAEFLRDLLRTPRRMSHSDHLLTDFLLLAPRTMYEEQCQKQ